MDSSYQEHQPRAIAVAGVEARATFITRTYLHLLGAILGFTLVEIYLFSSGLAYEIAQVMFGISWLLVLGGFVLVSWLASRVAHSAQSLVAQYAALAGFVVAEAIVFVPLLVLALVYSDNSVIESAALVTLLGFTGLTAVVYYTRKDFSFLGGVLRWAGIGALLLIVAGAIFGFQLGTFFSVGMVVLAGAAILYDTSNVLYNFPEDRHVAASLELFASVALMFWYVLRLFMASRD